MLHSQSGFARRPDRSQRQRNCRTVWAPAEGAGMTVIGWVLTRMMIVRFLFILFGISIFVVTLEIVTYVKQILQLGGGISVVFEYALLRSPAILSTFLPISALLAVLLVLMELIYRNEI